MSYKRLRGVRSSGTVTGATRLHTQAAAGSDNYQGACFFDDGRFDVDAFAGGHEPCEFDVSAFDESVFDDDPPGFQECRFDLGAFDDSRFG